MARRARRLVGEIAPEKRLHTLCHVTENGEGTKASATGLDGDFCLPFLTYCPQRNVGLKTV